MKSKSAILVGLAAAVLLPLPAIAQQVRPPVEDYYRNQTVKGFGVLVDEAFHVARRDLFPDNGFRNQFTGYHAGADIEFHEAADADRPVPVTAIADGQVVYVGSVAGYGGLIIVRHDAPEPVTSLYGHVRLADRTVETGQRVAAGHRLAYLGESFTADTSGARKHLHFGIHKGPAVDVEGHEPTPARLNAEWYNPNDWLARYGAGPVPAASAVPSATPSPAPTVTASPEPTGSPEPRPTASWLDRIVDFFKNLFG